MDTLTEEKQIRTKYYLTSENLTPELIYRISSENAEVDLTPECWENVREGRKIVEDMLKLGMPVYGLNTGFGSFATVKIPQEDVRQLQINLIRSHCCGVGQPLPITRVREIHLLRINVLSHGKSGISEETLRRVIDAFNLNIIPLVPEQGTVGASGDIAPLAHLTLGLIGEGKLWDVSSGSFQEASVVLKRIPQYQPLELKEKEGIAFINGTQFMTATGVEALLRAERLLRNYIAIFALTFDVLGGDINIFDEDVLEASAHNAQKVLGRKIRKLLLDEANGKGSQVNQQQVKIKTKCQDSYSLLCALQVFGMCKETLEYVRSILSLEVIGVTDNPLVFKDPASKQGIIRSGGNFHGQFPAQALDILAIAMQDLGAISERRIEHMVNGNLSNGLPWYLIREKPGINNGFMITQYTAAALVSENKVICHPSSVDSIPTSGEQEDHVSMGGFSARKALLVISNIERIAAIELISACQALDCLAPHRTTSTLHKIHDRVRLILPELHTDYVFSEYIEQVTKLLRFEELAVEFN